MSKIKKITVCTSASFYKESLEIEKELKKRGNFRDVTSFSRGRFGQDHPWLIRVFSFKLNEMRQLLFLAAVACFLLIFNLFVVNVFFLPEPFDFFSSPAARYCLKRGGERVTHQTQAGKKMIFCQFPNGLICEEGALYQGACLGGNP